MKVTNFVTLAVLGLALFLGAGALAKPVQSEPPSMPVRVEAAVLVGETIVYVELGPQVAPFVLTGITRTSPVIMGYNAAGSPIDSSGLAVASGLTAWNDYSPSFTYIYGGMSDVVPSICDGFLGGVSVHDGANTIKWAGTTVMLVAVACWSGQECDIALSPLAHWNIVDLQSVILHESGHCLGLGHSLDPEAAMFASLHGVVRVPGPDDIAGLCAIYGCGSVPTPTVSPTAVNTATTTPTQAPTAIPTATAVPTVTPTPEPPREMYRIFIPGLAN